MSDAKDLDSILGTSGKDASKKEAKPAEAKKTSETKKTTEAKPAAKPASDAKATEKKTSTAAKSDDSKSTEKTSVKEKVNVDDKKEFKEPTVEEIQKDSPEAQSTTDNSDIVDSGEYDVPEYDVNGKEIDNAAQEVKPTEDKPDEKSDDTDVGSQSTVKLTRSVSVFRGPSANFRGKSFGGTVHTTGKIQGQYTQVTFVRPGFGKCVGWMLTRDLR